MDSSYRSHHTAIELDFASDSDAVTVVAFLVMGGRFPYYQQWMLNDPQFHRLHGARS